MTGRCTREEARELDRRAMEEYGMPGLLLMENAGRGVAVAATEMLAAIQGRSVVIFCGKGNNGGDGYVAARHLHNRGFLVWLVAACAPDELEMAGDAGVNRRIVTHMGLPMVVAEGDTGQTDAAVLARKADLIIDALLGTGLSGEVREPYLTLIRLVNAEDKPVLSVDIPSGLDANTGQVLRAAVRAQRTATLVLPKVGFDLREGPAHVGEVIVVDIGVPQDLVADIH